MVKEYNFDMKREFACRLRDLRNERGLSIEELSKILGFGSASISRWENGKQDITGDNLIVLANFFKVTAGYLLGIED